MNMISSGFPNNKHVVAQEIAEYWQMRNELFNVVGVIFAANSPLTETISPSGLTYCTPGNKRHESQGPPTFLLATDEQSNSTSAK